MIGSVILIIVFTFLNAVFASAEIAVISMNEAKLRHLVDDGNKRAKKLSLLTEQYFPIRPLSFRRLWHLLLR